MLSLSLNDLIAYTDWDRQKWHAWFRQNGEPALQISAGPHGDGRMETAADVVRHPLVQRIVDAYERHEDE